MARPLTQSDLIFPTNSLSLSSTLSSLKRRALSIPNRLASITSDSAFVTSVSEAYGLPLVANERCGSWYIPPQKKAGSCYFKSTDGHVGEWGFSLRRVNLQVLDVLGKYGGCVIVDSTRRGKSMPDALSKTIPIWACVLNRALFPDLGPHELYTPPTAVSASEHAQIEKRIDAFVRSFLEICNPSIDHLRNLLSNKPLRPLWVTQSSSLPPDPPSFEDFHPIICCTASRRVHGAEVSEHGYIQGAADDHEAWANGLTPVVFWQNHELLMRTNEEDFPFVIGELVAKEKGPEAVPTLIKPTTTLYVSASENLDLAPFDVVISCAPKLLTTTKRGFVKSKRYLHLPLQPGKLGSRDLRAQLSRLPLFLDSVLREREAAGKEAPSILACDPTGKDLAVGVALTILCLYADERGAIALPGSSNSTAHANRRLDKTFIKQRLSWITTTSGALNPSRETLKAVNSFLMPEPGSKGKEVVANVPDGDKVGDELVLVDDAGNLIESNVPEGAKQKEYEQEESKDVSVPTLEKPDTPVLSSHSKTGSPDILSPESLAAMHIPVTDIPYDLLPKQSPSPPSQSLSSLSKSASPAISCPTSALGSSPGEKQRSPPTTTTSDTSRSSDTGSPSLPKKLFTTLASVPKWRFERTLTSHMDTLPSGTATGIATFEPYSPSSSAPLPSAGSDGGDERHALLYTENSEFVTEKGLRLTAKRQYIYRLERTSTSSPSQAAKQNHPTTIDGDGEEEEEFIALYFPPDSPDAVPDAKNLFVEMGPIFPSSSSSSGVAAKVYEAQHREKHLCGNDLYSARWSFGQSMFDAAATIEQEGSKWWELRYDVDGPRKNYVSVTRYTALL